MGPVIPAVYHLTKGHADGGACAAMSGREPLSHLGGDCLAQTFGCSLTFEVGRQY